MWLVVRSAPDSKARSKEFTNLNLELYGKYHPDYSFIILISYESRYSTGGLDESNNGLL